MSRSGPRSQGAGLAGMDRAINFDPRAIGPVATRFFSSLAPVAVIMGPQGGAKTTTAFMRALQIACAWPPSKIDGIRYCRMVVVRDTYPNLEQTTLKSWLAWFPKSVGRFTAGTPAVHLLDFTHRGSRVMFEVIFRAVGDLDVEEVFRGFEPNIVMVDELDTISPELLYNALGRVLAGRYPGAQHGVMVPGFFMGAMNAPDEDNWTHRLLVENLPQGWEFHRQPSGLSAQAENLAHLAPGYYQALAQHHPDWWVRRYVRNEFGYSRDGQPVYPEFSDTLHVASAPLQADPDLPLILGVDGGGTPALVLGQLLPNGAARILDELTSEAGTGAVTFAERTMALLASRYANHDRRAITAFADPSTEYGKTLGAKGTQSWLDLFAATSQIRTRPSRCNNDPVLRMESLRHAFKRPLIDHQPALLVSPTCRNLRKALNSKYRYRRKQIAGDHQFEDKPDKSHPWSDVAEAAQYFYLNAAGVKEIIDRKALAVSRFAGARGARTADLSGLS